MDDFEETPLPHPRSQAHVFGADGTKIGMIVAVGHDFMVVERGHFFPIDYYIPLDAIAALDPHRVVLTVHLNATLAREWAAGPAEEPALQTAPETAAPIEPETAESLEPEPEQTAFTTADESPPAALAPLTAEPAESATENAESNPVTETETETERSIELEEPERDSLAPEPAAESMKSEPETEPNAEPEEPERATLAPEAAAERTAPELETESPEEPERYTLTEEPIASPGQSGVSGDDQNPPAATETAAPLPNADDAIQPPQATAKPQEEP